MVPGSATTASPVEGTRLAIRAGSSRAWPAHFAGLIRRNYSTFAIENEMHAELQGTFATLSEAVAELERRASIPWNEAPNLSPCTNWANCRRTYELVEYDDSKSPWKELS